MKFVDFSMSVLFLSAAFLLLVLGLFMANEIYMCYKPEIVDVDLQSAYDQGYADGHETMAAISDN